MASGSTSTRVRGSFWGVRQIRLWQGRQLRLLHAEDTALAEGFHAFEPDNGFRWTDGNAVLPASLFAGRHGACHMRPGGATWYPLLEAAEGSIAT